MHGMQGRFAGVSLEGGCSGCRPILRLLDAPHPTLHSTFRRLLGFAAAHRRLLVWSIVLALAAQAFALAIPSFTGRAIDEAIQPHDRSSLWMWVWADRRRRA